MKDEGPEAHREAAALIRKFCLLLSAAGSLLAIQSVHAASITYTFTATGNGGLGNLAFFNAPFTITSTADPNSIAITAPGVFQVPDLTATVSVLGIGTANFTIPTVNVANQGLNRAGISDSTLGRGILAINSAAFGTYDLSTSLGPVSGTAVFNLNSRFSTTLGDFFLNSASQGTFQVVLVPEPGSVALFCLGAVLASRVIVRRRREPN